MKVGKKIYLVCDPLGGEIFLTRKEAREYKETVDRAFIIETPITEHQQKLIQTFERETLNA